MVQEKVDIVQTGAVYLLVEVDEVRPNHIENIFKLERAFESSGYGVK